MEKQNTAEQNLALVRAWQKDECFRARERLVLGVMNLIQALVNRFSIRHRDDLLQEGLLGVLKACDTYDPKNGASFLTFAKYCANLNIMDYIRRDHVIPRGSQSMHHNNLSYREIPKSHSEIKTLVEETGLPYKTVAKYAMLGATASLERAEARTAGDDPVFRDVAALEEIEQVKDKLNTLSDRDLEILIASNIEGDTHNVIAEGMGLTRQRVQQIVKDVQIKLKM